MKKFIVYLCAPVLTWEGVEAETEQEAIDKCQPPEYYGGESTTYLVEDVTLEEEEEGDDD